MVRFYNLCCRFNKHQYKYKTVLPPQHRVFEGLLPLYTLAGIQVKCPYQNTYINVYLLLTVYNLSVMHLLYIQYLAVCNTLASPQFDQQYAKKDKKKTIIFTFCREEMIMLAEVSIPLFWSAGLLSNAQRTTQMIADQRTGKNSGPALADYRNGASAIPLI